MAKVFCRCCGRRVTASDGYPIHTRCMVRHWTRHIRWVNASRCREFGPKPVPQELEEATATLEEAIATEEEATAKLEEAIATQD